MSAKNTPAAQIAADEAAELELEQAIGTYALAVSGDLASVSGCLQYGLPYDGALHYEFAMHLPTVGEDLAIDPALSGQERMLAVYAAVLDRLGGIPAGKIDAALLAAHLSAADFDALYFAQELLLKKRRRPTAGTSATA